MGRSEGHQGGRADLVVLTREQRFEFGAREASELDAAALEQFVEPVGDAGVVQGHGLDVDQACVTLEQVQPYAAGIEIAGEPSHEALDELAAGAGGHDLQRQLVEALHQALVFTSDAGEGLELGAQLVIVPPQPRDLDLDQGARAGFVRQYE